MSEIWLEGSYKVKAPESDSGAFSKAINIIPF